MKWANWVKLGENVFMIRMELWLHVPHSFYNVTSYHDDRYAILWPHRAHALHSTRLPVSVCCSLLRCLLAAAFRHRQARIFRVKTSNHEGQFFLPISCFLQRKCGGLRGKMYMTNAKQVTLRNISISCLNRFLSTVTPENNTRSASIATRPPLLVLAQQAVFLSPPPMSGTSTMSHGSAWVSGFKTREI